MTWNVGDEKQTIATPAPLLAADEYRRRAPIALVEGLSALKRDGAKDGLNEWSWPTKGEETRVEIAGTRELSTFQAKIKGARLDNVWRESTVGAAAVPFSSSPSVSGWGSTMEDFDNSVDDQGRSFGAYWADQFFWKIVSGIDFTLVEMPAELGGKAYWVALRAGSVLGIQTELSNGRIRLVEARIRLPGNTVVEPQEDPDSWKIPSPAPKVRVYRVSERLGLDPGGPVYFRESQKTEDGKKWVWVTDWQPLDAESGATFTEVPLVPFYGNRVAPYRGWPLFYDTAYQQMSLWRKTLDYDLRERRDAKNVAVVTGATQSDASFDGEALYIESKDAEVTLMETTGEALEALRKSQEEIRESIRTGNLRPLTARPQTTATATEIKANQLEASSILEMLILLDISSYKIAMSYTRQLNGDGDEVGEVDLRHDFGRDGFGMKEIWNGYIKSGGKLVPPKVVWDEARRNRWIGEHHTVKGILSDIAARNTRPVQAGDVATPEPSPLSANRRISTE